jgi:dolichol-phosphate mannosyltransferase
VATIHVLMPALNEAANIGRVLEAVNAASRRTDLEIRVVLVDDGSTDGTGQHAITAAGDLPLTVLRHEQPRGPGRAFATGFEFLATVLGEDDYVLTLEADNTSRLELLDRMLLRSAEGYDVVLASPYAYGGGILRTTAFRTLLSHIANLFVKEFLGIRGLLTISSFYRLYRGSALLRLQRHYGPGIVERAGFESMVELVLKMVYLRMSISEVPMVLDTGLRIGASRMNVSRTAFGYFALFRRKGAWRARAST